MLLGLWIELSQRRIRLFMNLHINQDAATDSIARIDHSKDLRGQPMSSQAYLPLGDSANKANPGVKEYARQIHSRTESSSLKSKSDTTQSLPEHQ